MIPQNREDRFYESIIRGWVEVRGDGSIWRIAQCRGNRWNDSAPIKPLANPHRIDGTPAPGYRNVSISIDGTTIGALAHRVVWLHFNGQIPPGLTINHKNGNKADNRPENLELATYSEQVIHAREVLGKMSQRGEKNNNSILSERAAREIKRRRRAGESLKALAQAFGVSDKTISKIALGQRWNFIGSEKCQQK